MSRPLALLLAVLAVAIFAGVAFFRAAPPRSAGSPILEIDGRIEAAREVVPARVPGKLIAFTAAVGDRVLPRQVIARLQDPRMMSTLAIAEDALTMLESELRSEQANLAREQLRIPLTIHAAESSLSLARRMLETLQEDEQRLRTESDSLGELEESDEAALQRRREAELEHQLVARQRTEAEAGVERAQADLELARLGEDDLVSSIHRINEIVRKRDAAAAALRAATVGEGDLEVVAPSAGVIIAARASVGDTLSIGDPVVEMIDPGAVSVVATAAGVHRPAIRPGQAARVYFAGAPGGHVGAHVSAILDAPAGDVIVKLAFDSTPDPPPPTSLPCKVRVRIRDDAPWP